MSDTEGQGPQPPNGENDIEQFLDRFATREARVIIRGTKWFLYVAVAAIGIEFSFPLSKNTFQSYTLLLLFSICSGDLFLFVMLPFLSFSLSSRRSVRLTPF